MNLTEPVSPIPDEHDWGQTSLLSYHGPDGKPLTPVVPDAEIQQLSWNARYEVRRRLGQGAQGVVYLARRSGADGYFTNVALKVFFRHPRLSAEAYTEEMRRIATQSQRVSQIQHDNIISIRDFVSLDDTRVMVVEWVDGLDLARLLDLRRLKQLQRRLPEKMGRHLTDVLVEPGEDHCRVKPGIAVDILRGCLAGLSSLHHAGIAHCDLKPSNVMVKRTGTKKLIDLDSSLLITESQGKLRGTPYYMAPEQLLGKPLRLRSDVASLGYMLIEMLTGKYLFRKAESISQLLLAKQNLPKQLHTVLPREIRRDELLYGLISKMIAVDPQDRFPDADAAELDKVGAVSFHRHLVKTDLDTEYERELAWWLELLHAHDLYRGNEGIEGPAAPRDSTV